MGRSNVLNENSGVKIERYYVKHAGLNLFSLGQGNTNNNFGINVHRENACGDIFLLIIFEFPLTKQYDSVAQFRVFFGVFPAKK